jgi:hypothetical protein
MAGVQHVLQRKERTMETLCLRAYHFPIVAPEFDWCLPGELLWVQGPTCTGEETQRCCGCGRSFTGCQSQRGTTRGLVQRSDETALAAEVHTSITAQHGERTLGSPWRQQFETDCTTLSRALLAGGFPVGTPLTVSVTDTEFVLRPVWTGEK